MASPPIATPVHTHTHNNTTPTTTTTTTTHPVDRDADAADDDVAARTVPRSTDPRLPELFAVCAAPLLPLRACVDAVPRDPAHADPAARLRETLVRCGYLRGPLRTCIAGTACAREKTALDTLLAAPAGPSGGATPHAAGQALRRLALCLRRYQAAMLAAYNRDTQTLDPARLDRLV